MRKVAVQALLQARIAECFRELGERDHVCRYKSKITPDVFDTKASPMLTATPPALATLVV